MINQPQNKYVEALIKTVPSVRHYEVNLGGIEAILREFLRQLVPEAVSMRWGRCLLVLRLRFGEPSDIVDQLSKLKARSYVLLARLEH